MYWPLGIASVFSVPPNDDGSEPAEQESKQKNPLVSLGRSSSGSILATITSNELFIWQAQVAISNPAINCKSADGSRCISTSIPKFSGQLRSECQSCASWRR